MHADTRYCIIECGLETITFVQCKRRGNTFTGNIAEVITEKTVSVEKEVECSTRVCPREQRRKNGTQPSDNCADLIAGICRETLGAPERT